LTKHKKDAILPESPVIPVSPPANVEQPAPAVDYLDALRRLKAEFENYRKRIDREKPEYIRLGQSTVLAKLLPLYDLLQKAQQEALDSHNDTPLGQGMAGIFKEFDKLFREEGVALMDPLNKPFNALQHEVLGAVERDDCAEGLVVEVLQNGFLLQDRVLRTAKVRISRKSQKEDGPAMAGK